VGEDEADGRGGDGVLEGAGWGVRWGGGGGGAGVLVFGIFDLREFFWGGRRFLGGFFEVWGVFWGIVCLIIAII
jgi:hypothetical protein